jgi:heterodisulfide reductase subunit C
METVDCTVCGDPRALAALPETFHICYQCRKCTAGCPVAERSDLPIDQILGWLKLGQIERVLRAEQLWICVGCHACSARCPNQVDPGRLLDHLRALALAHGIEPPARVKHFHDAFLSVVERSGRSHEVGMMSRFYLKERPAMSDIKAGYRLFLKGRLKPLGSKIKDRRMLRKIFRLHAGEEGEPK